MGSRGTVSTLRDPIVLPHSDFGIRAPSATIIRRGPVARFSLTAHPRFTRGPDTLSSSTRFMDETRNGV